MRRGFCFVAILVLGLMVIPAWGEKSKDPGFPCQCVLWPVYSDDVGTLYYCDDYQSNCTDEPQADYAYGTYPWPQYCGSCNPEVRDHTTSPFPGMTKKIQPTDTLQLPSALASQYARFLSDPDIQYVKMIDNAKTPASHCAKVFCLL